MKPGDGPSPCAISWRLSYSPSGRVCRLDCSVTRLWTDPRESWLAAMGLSTLSMESTEREVCGLKIASAISMVSASHLMLPVKRSASDSDSCDAVLAFRILAHDRPYHHDHSPSTASSPHYSNSVGLHLWAATTVLAPDSLSRAGISLSGHDPGSHCGHRQPFYT